MKRKKQIVQFIVKTYVDPKSHLPHPPIRVEQAMKDARVSVDPQKSVDEQMQDIVEKLRSIIALKSENLQLEIISSCTIRISIIRCSQIRRFSKK